MSTLRHTLIFIFFSAIFLNSGCGKEPTGGAIINPSSSHVNFVNDDGEVTCNTDGNAFFSCSRDNTYPFDGASLLFKDVELSFANVDGKATMISPADRHYFSGLWTYTNALSTTFMNTGILAADFDTLRTDYLFQDYAPGDYYLTLSSGMSCIFFRCVNGNYGLIKLSGLVGNGSGNSPFTINFEVKYVEKVN